MPDGKEISSCKVPALKDLEPEQDKRDKAKPREDGQHPHFHVGDACMGQGATAQGRRQNPTAAIGKRNHVTSTEPVTTWRKIVPTLVL